LDSLPVTIEGNPLLQKQSAPVFIAEQIKKYSSELCIITLGPLTNLALAYHRTQDIKLLSSIRINGGAFTGVGNVINSTGSEGNLYYDPEAAHIVITVSIILDRITAMFT
jgi:purine nucleosidase